MIVAIESTTLKYVIFSYAKHISMTHMLSNKIQNDSFFSMTIAMYYLILKNKQIRLFEFQKLGFFLITKHCRVKSIDKNLTIIRLNQKKIEKEMLYYSQNNFEDFCLSNSSMNHIFFFLWLLVF